MPKVEREDVLFLGQPSFRVLPKNVSAVLKNTATPDISNLLFVRGSGSVVTITNFIGGQDSQTLKILGDGSTTIKNNTNIFTNTAADKLLAVHKVYRFTYYQATMQWFEDA